MKRQPTSLFRRARNLLIGLKEDPTLLLLQLFLILSKFLDAVITIQITIKYDLFLLDVETFFGNSGI